MPENFLERYRPITEIRTNHRFATFEGNLDDRKVFIKYAVDAKLRGRLANEAKGLRAMKRLDPHETLFYVPEAIIVADDHIVTEWVNGHPMKDDFIDGKIEAIKDHLSFLVEVYAFVDQRGFGHGDKISHVTKELVDKHLAALEGARYYEYVDTGLVRGIADYIIGRAPGLEVCPTHGDLQPGNLMVGEGNKPTVIDCESYALSWPRHYNIVNFIFNYGVEFPELTQLLDSAFYRYCEKLEVDPSGMIDAFNVSAALRCLQLLQERLSTGEGLASGVKSYTEATMDNILAGRLFFVGD